MATLGIFAASVVACAAPSSHHAATASDGTDGSGANGTSPTGTAASSSTATGASTASGSVTAAAPGVSVTIETLNVGGLDRGYVLVQPTELPQNASLPVVFVLHGDGDDGPAMHTRFPLEATSGQGAFLVYPTGTNHTWDLYTPTATNVDMPFVTALVTALEARLPIDTSKVFATGFSSGAFMLNQLSCRNPSLFRAIASQSGGSPNEPNDPSASKWDNGYTKCAAESIGSGPAVLAVHGTADATVDYQSGVFDAVYWAYINGCGQTETSDQPSCQRYDSCPSTKPVVFCSVPNMGHDLWTGAATTIWTFFSGF